MRGFVDLQLAPDALSRIIAEQLRGAGITVLDTFDHAGERYLIDHIDVGAGALRPGPLQERRISLPSEVVDGRTRQAVLPRVPSVQLRQEVTFFVTTERELLAAAIAPQTAWAVEIRPGEGARVPVLIDLTVSAAGNQALLGARIVDIDAGVAALLAALPGDLGELAAEIRRRLFPDPGMPSPLDGMTPRPIPIDLSSVSSLLGRDLPVANAGIRVDISPGATPRLTVRLELDDVTPERVSAWMADARRIDSAPGSRIGASSTSELRTRLDLMGEERRRDWTMWYASDAADRLVATGGGPPRDWAVAISSTLLVDIVRERINQTVTSSSAFRSRSGRPPTVTWSAASGVPRVDVHIDGSVREACHCGWSRIDVDTGVDVSFAFGMPRRDVVSLDVRLDWHASFLHAACCVLTGAVLWPVIGAIELGGGRVGGLAYVGGLLVDLPARLVAGIIAAATAGPGDRLSLDAGSIPLERRNDHELHGEVSLAGRLRLDRFPALVASGVDARTDALVLAGSFGAMVNPPLATLHCRTPLDFAWSVLGECGDLRVRDAASMTISNAGGRFVFLRDVVIRDDPDGLFRSALRWRGGSGAVMLGPRSSREIGVEVAAERFAGRTPRPCRVLIRTDRGARLVEINGAAPLGEDDVAEMLRLREVDCEARRRDFLLVAPDQASWLFDPLFDPRPDEADLDWRVLVLATGRGLGPAERVAILDAEGATRAAVFTTREGAFEISVLADLQAVTGASLARSKGQLLLDDLVPDRKPDEAVDLTVRQVLLRHERTLSAPGELLAMATGSWQGHEVLLLTGQDGLGVVSAPTAEVLAEVSGAGLRGAVTSGDALVAFGDPGLLVLRPGRRIEALHDQPVLGAVAVDEGAIALTASGLALWPTDGSKPAASTASEPAVSAVLTTAEGVVAVTGSGFQRVQVRDGMLSLEPLLSAKVSDAVVAPGPGTRLLATVNGILARLDVSDPARPRPVVVIDATAPAPWDATAATVTDGVVVPTADARSVDLVRVHDLRRAGLHPG